VVFEIFDHISGINYLGVSWLHIFVSTTSDRMSCLLGHVRNHLSFIAEEVLDALFWVFFQPLRVDLVDWVSLSRGSLRNVNTMEVLLESLVSEGLDFVNCVLVHFLSGTNLTTNLALATV
jgi:hypothetical protein